MIVGVPFQVIGGLREKGLGPDGKGEDANTFVPLTTVVRCLFLVFGVLPALRASWLAPAEALRANDL